MAAALTKALGQEVRYNNVPPEVYRGFGFPGADDLGNMFQFKRDFNDDYCGARDLAFARALNPELQTFAQWLTRAQGRDSTRLEAAPVPIATLNEALERAAEFPATGIRLLDRQESAEWLPWSEIRRQALAVAGGLQALGLERGERVGLVYPTCADFLAAFFGALLAGGVPVPLYPPLRLGRLEEYQRQTARMLETSGAAIVLAEARVRRILGEAMEMARPRLGCLALADLEPRAAAPIAVETDDLALVQFSSGTTVDPKPVALTHRALLAQVDAINTLWPDRPAEGVVHSAVSWLPLYHDMGLVGIVSRRSTGRGSRRSCHRRPSSPGRRSGCARCRAIAPRCRRPPTSLTTCASRGCATRDLEGVDLSEWRMALNGAEPVVPHVLRAFRDRFARWGLRPEALTPVYGLSEASLAVTISDLERPFTGLRCDRRALEEEGVVRDDPTGRELVSLGRPVPGAEVAVRDPGGFDVGERRVGRVWVRGPSLMKEYLGQPEATAAVLRRRLARHRRPRVPRSRRALSHRARQGPAHSARPQPRTRRGRARGRERAGRAAGMRRRGEPPRRGRRGGGAAPVGGAAAQRRQDGARGAPRRLPARRPGRDRSGRRFGLRAGARHSAADLLRQAAPPGDTASPSGRRPVAAGAGLAVAPRRSAPPLAAGLCAAAPGAERGRALMARRPAPLRVVLLKPSKYAEDGWVERFRWGFMPNSTLAHLAA